MAIDQLSPSIWREIYAAIERSQNSREVYQGLVTDRDPTRGFVWVHELSTDPIEVVGHSLEMSVIQNGSRIQSRIPPATPEIGDVVTLVRTASDQFKCVGVQHTTRKWVADPLFGLIPADSITAREIAPDAVGSSEIAADAVGNSELAPDAVTNIEVAAAAAIAYSKLNLAGAITNADLAGAIEGSKLNYHVGTSPPGSPSDGDLWYCTAGSWNMLLMYFSSEATYKWRNIGSPSAVMVSHSTTDEATSGTVTFAAPRTTVQRAGDYLVGFSSQVDGTPNAGTRTTWQEWLYNVTDAADLSERSTYSFDAIGSFLYQAVLGFQGQPVNIAAGKEIGIRAVSTNWDHASRHRQLTIIPVRVI